MGSVEIQTLKRKHVCRSRRTRQAQEARKASGTPALQRHGGRRYQGPQGQERLQLGRHQEVRRCQLQGRPGQDRSVPSQGSEEGRRGQEAGSGQGLLQIGQGGEEAQGQEGRQEARSEKDTQEEGSKEARSQKVPKEGAKEARSEKGRPQGQEVDV